MSRWIQTLTVFAGLMVGLITPSLAWAGPRPVRLTLKNKKVYEGTLVRKKKGLFHLKIDGLETDIKEEDVVKVEFLKVKKKATKPGHVTSYFKDADVRKVLMMLAAAGKNDILISQQVRGSVTLDFKEVPWRDALNAVCSATGHRIFEDKGCLVIMTKDGGQWYTEPGLYNSGLFGLNASERKAEKDKAQNVTLRFEDADYKTVLNLLTTYSGKNFVVENGVRGDFYGSLQGRDWLNALDLISRFAGLRAELQGSIVVVKWAVKNKHKPAKATPKKTSVKKDPAAFKEFLDAAALDKFIKALKDPKGKLRPFLKEFFITGSSEDPSMGVHWTCFPHPRRGEKVKPGWHTFEEAKWTLDEAYVKRAPDLREALGDPSKIKIVNIRLDDISDLCETPAGATIKTVASVQLHSAWGHKVRAYFLRDRVLGWCIERSRKAVSADEKAKQALVLKRAEVLLKALKDPSQGLKEFFPGQAFSITQSGGAKVSFETREYAGKTLEKDWQKEVQNLHESLGPTLNFERTHVWLTDSKTALVKFPKGRRDVFAVGFGEGVAVVEFYFAKEDQRCLGFYIIQTRRRR